MKLPGDIESLKEIAVIVIGFIFFTIVGVIGLELLDRETHFTCTTKYVDKHGSEECEEYHQQGAEQRVEYHERKGR